MNHCANCNGAPRVEADHDMIRRNADASVREMTDTARGVLLQCASDEGLDVMATVFKPLVWALERAGYVTMGISMSARAGYRETAYATKSGRLALELHR